MEKENTEIELTEDELLVAIKESGLSKSFESYVSKYSDRKVSEGIESFKKNQGKKDLTDKERLQEVESELAKMKSDKATNDIKSEVKKELKAQGLNEGLLKYIKLEGLDDQSKIVEAVESFKNDFLTQEQESIDSKLKGNEPPKKGETFTGTGMDTAVKEFAKKISAKEK